MRGQVTLTPNKDSILINIPRTEKTNQGFKKNPRSGQKNRDPHAGFIYHWVGCHKNEVWQELLYLIMVNIPSNYVKCGWYNRRGENMRVLTV